jgi:diguanylate cyclase (GGDEF)-like protein
MDQLADLFGQFGIQFFLNHTQILIARIDSDGRLQEWNPALGKMKDICPASVLIQDFLTPACQPVFVEAIQSKEPRQTNLEFSFGSKKINFISLFLPVPGGDFLLLAEPDQAMLDEKITHLTNNLMQAEHALEIKKIDLESVLAQANEISHTDPLTFLPNRRKIIADLQRAVNDCGQSKKPLTIFMLDIDHFKLVNDTFGHIAGDRALQVMATHLQESIRENDKIGRYGGEEFVAVLPGTNEKSATKLAERLLNIVRKLEIPFDGKTIKITVSIGIAQCHTGLEGWEELLKRADMALYQSKQNGRDRWTVSEG